MKWVLKIRLVGMILLCSAWLTWGIWAQNAVYSSQEDYVSDCHNVVAAFTDGESLEYKAYYHWTAIWVGMGKLKMELQKEEWEGKEVLHAVAKGETLKRYDWFFKVRDNYESYLEAATLRPLKFIRQVREGGYTKNLQYTYNDDRSSLILDFHRSQGKTREENVEKKINFCTQDLLSAFYYLRSMDLSDLIINEEIPVELIIDGELYPVHLQYLGKEKTKTEFGKIECLKFVPLLLEGEVFEDGDRMEVYVSADKNLLPLVIKSSLSVGEIKVYLTKASGLKYPF